MKRYCYLCRTCEEHTTEAGCCDRCVSEITARVAQFERLAAPREGWGERRKRQEARLLSEIRAHDCGLAKCGPICTFGDW